MRLSDAETDRAERRSQECFIHRSFELPVKGSFVNQVLQREQSGNIGFRFLDRAVRFLQLLPHRGCAAADSDIVRSESVHQFMHEDVREEGFE